MKKYLISSALALTLMACGGQTSLPSLFGQNGPGAQASPSPGPSTSPNPSPTVTVTIDQGAVGKGSAAYGTNPLIVDVGTTVTWVNNDTVPHTATSETGVWDTGTIDPGQSSSETFDTPGIFPYFCSIHGQASMSGVIQVGPSPSPSASPSATPSVAPGTVPSGTPTGQPYAVAPAEVPNMNSRGIPNVTFRAEQRSR